MEELGKSGKALLAVIMLLVVAALVYLACNPVG